MTRFRDEKLALYVGREIWFFGQNELLEIDNWWVGAVAATTILEREAAKTRCGFLCVYHGSEPVDPNRDSNRTGRSICSIKFALPIRCSLAITTRKAQHSFHAVLASTEHLQT